MTTCRECAAPISGQGLFCSAFCRMAFNNRRMQRGAELYDLFRAMRRERDWAVANGLWKNICRLEQKWQEEDERDRPGRRSYAPPEEAVSRLIDGGRISRAMTQREMDESNAKRKRVNAAKQAKTA